MFWDNIELEQPDKDEEYTIVVKNQQELDEKTQPLLYNAYLKNIALTCSNLMFGRQLYDEFNDTNISLIQSEKR